MEVYRRRRKTQALAGTTFAERLKPLFVYHLHRCFDNYHKGVQVYGCDCGIGGGGDGSVSDCLGGREDATTKEGMRWSKDFFMSCLLNFFFFNCSRKKYILYT